MSDLLPHPEETCQRCGRPNLLSWSVDSDRFNLAMKGLELTRAAIVCPSCFVEGHEKATGLRSHWVLVPDMFRWIDHEGNEPEIIGKLVVQPTEILVEGVGLAEPEDRRLIESWWRWKLRLWYMRTTLIRRADR